MKREDGFTLISVLVAMVMLSMGVLAMSRAGAQSMAVQSMAGNRTTALAIGRTYMEFVRSRPSAQLASEPPVEVDETGTVSPGGFFTRSVDVASRRHNLKEIKVTVTFPRSRIPIELVTLTYVGN